ncbi:MAG: hypothetical protein H7Z13_15725 [Ferruginibacter sp.]|nr:hypothetical protein [Ferruginibacter sp.]
MHPRKKIIVPLIALFVIFSGSLTASKNLLAKWGIDYNVLIIANALFFIISLIAFFMQQKALHNTNPNVFVRSVMAGMLIKMFICVTAVITYRLVAGNNVSKLSVFAAMFLYLLYLGVEVAVITKLNKQHNA